MVMSCIKKEGAMFLRQKKFIMLVLVFAFVYGVVGYGISKAAPIPTEVRQETVFYFMFIYPLALIPMMLQMYPVAKDMGELSNGGIENLLCTGCRLSDIILGKAVCLWCSLMFPSAVLIICLMFMSHQWLFGALSLVGTTPFTIAGISLVYVSQGMKRKYVGNIMKAGYLAILCILVLTYFPMICEKITGQVMNIFVSIILAVVLAVISFGLGLHFYPKVNVEEII